MLNVKTKKRRMKNPNNFSIYFICATFKRASMKNRFMTVLKSLPFIILFDGYFIGDCSTTWIGFYIKHWDQDGCVWTRLFMNTFGQYAGIVILKVLTVGLIFGIIYIMSRQRIEKSGIKLLDIFWGKYYTKIMNFNAAAFALGIWGYVISVLNVLIITGIIKNCSF